MKLYSKIPWLISMMLGASSVNAIEISPDDRGQLLIAPVYQASEGKSTEIRVVNPSKTHAVKTIVSVRSAANSLEILNFNLYLTPTDVWTGELRNTGSGVELYSEDDSILVGLNGGGLSTDSAVVTGVFASPGNGVTLSTFNERDSEQQVELGHFEVMGVYSVYGEDIYPGMPKSTLFAIDNISYNNDTFLQNGVVKGGLFDGYAPINTPYDCRGNAVTDLPNHDTGLQTYRIDPDTLIHYDYCVNTRDDYNIKLFGEAVLKLNPAAGAFRYDLLALRNSEESEVIANPLYDSVTQQDTPLGVRMGRINRFGYATDNIEYISAALRHATFEGIYDSLEPKATNPHVTEAGEAESMLVVTFPFKYRYLHSSSPDYTFDPVRRDFGRSSLDIPIEVLNDNSDDRQGTSFDATFDHYDYDYGYSDHAFYALNRFNTNGAPLGYPNHGRNRAFIYGETAYDDFGLILWDPVTFHITSWDTSERFEVVEAGSFTTVISGGPGIDTDIDKTVLPNEVNLITDENNQLWYSTKGWYEATFSYYGYNYGYEYEYGHGRGYDYYYPAPTIVMTLTTDTMAQSRIDYAVTTDQPEILIFDAGNGAVELETEVSAEIVE